MKHSRVYTAVGIVIKRVSIGEGDRIITLFTKNYGKIRIIARGVRKISSRRAPHIEVFTHVNATIHKGKQETLSEVSTITPFTEIRSDLKRVHAAYYLCELIDGLLPFEQIHEDVFDLLHKALSTLGKVRNERITILRDRFAGALLRILGFLEYGGKPPDHDINAYVENILERRLKTVRLASRINI